jgi:hypothetical protein
VSAAVPGAGGGGNARHLHRCAPGEASSAERQHARRGVLLRRFGRQTRAVDVKGLNNNLLDKLGARDDGPPGHGRRR